MESKNIIIILLVMVVILAVALGVMFLSPLTAKEDCNLTVVSNDTLYGGDNLTVKLTGVNGTPISNQTVNITIVDSEESYNYKSVVTNSEGIANLTLNKSAGNYTINCTYFGNEKYGGNSTIQKLEILDEIVGETSSRQSDSSYSSSSSSSKSSQSDYRPAVDSGGVTREEADSLGWQYTPEHGGHYHGSRDAWDEEAGVYHD